MAHPVQFDGNLKLDETRDAVLAEHLKGFQLDSIKFGTVKDDGDVFLVNNAEFHTVSSNKVLNNLLFVEAGDDAAEVKKKKVDDEKWTCLFDSDIYVENHVTRVMGFGKKGT